MSNRRSRVRVLMALALSIGTSMAAPLVQASPSWPVKPVRLVVLAPGGGGTADPLARLLARLERRSLRWADTYRG